FLNFVFQILKIISFKKKNYYNIFSCYRYKFMFLQSLISLQFIAVLLKDYFNISLYICCYCQQHKYIHPYPVLYQMG
uniref:Uncharacterized protein n=1 Tax=Amphimedon queenslandica TaxID=400682 RepID=A0A1X7TD64_AMPQE